jgi:hypothetical protein
LRAPSFLEIYEVKRLFDIEKGLKLHMKSPFFDSAISALLAAASMVVIILELHALFANFSWDDKIENSELSNTDEPLGFFHGYAKIITWLALADAFKTGIKYRDNSPPPEVIGELNMITRQNVTGMNRIRILALVNKLIKKHAIRHSEAGSFMEMDKIRLKLDSRIQAHDKLIKKITQLLHGSGVILVAAGALLNGNNNKNEVNAKALIIYLTAGLVFDLGFLINLVSYYVPKTGTVLTDHEIDTITKVLENDAIVDLPADADDAIHLIRRSSLKFFSAASPKSEEVKTDIQENKLSAPGKIY